MNYNKFMHMKYLPILLILLVGLDFTTGIIRFILSAGSEKHPTPLMILLPVILIFTILILTKKISLHKYLLKTNVFYIWLIFLFIGLIWSLWGLLNLNDFKDVINDGISFWLYPISGMLILITLGHKDNISKKIDIYISIPWKMGILLIIMYFIMIISFFISMNPDNPVFSIIYNMLDNHYIIFHGNYIELFSLNTLILPSIFFLGLIFFLHSENKLLKMVYGILIFLCLLLIFIVYVRMLWAAVFIGIIIFAYYFKTFRLVTIIGILIIGTIIALIPDFNTVLINRILSIFDTGQSSNSMKIEQAYYLIEGFYNHPIWGNGFGLDLHVFYRGVDKSYSFEDDMIALLAKLGIIGYSILWGIIGWIIWSFHRLALYYKKQKMTKLSMLSVWGIISVLVLVFADFTNPYFISQLGILYFMYFVILLDILILIKKRVTHNEA